ncbi:MAG: N-acetyl sugar amidotransferase [Rhodospirillales bacterium]|jgi:N-acetyl sugar amidotransferase|nr:N-acetyl sugar amidotransferase [Rhodospirillales bacterium]
MTTPTKTPKTEENSPKTLFGLPKEVQFCKKCVMSNQRPSSTVEFKNLDKKETLAFDDEGVCSACRIHERKWDGIDWGARQKDLEELLDRHRSSDGSYDVIVPGSGGKDSMYVSHVLKYKFGMHPLTITWPPHMYTDIGRINFDAWIAAGFDNVSFTPNGDVHRLLTREAFLNLLHPFQPFILGQKNIGPKMALQYGVKLIVYGENEAEGGSRIKFNNTMNTQFFASPRDERRDVVIGKRSYNELIDLGLSHHDLEPYLPIALEDLQEAGIEMHYMSFYENWRCQEKYYFAQEHCGFQPNPERTEGTYTKFASLDDKIDGLQYYTTHIKFGIGRATYDAAYDIRHRYIDRDEGVALVKRYDGEFPQKYFQDCLDYMEINEEQFYETLDNFRSPHLWMKEADEWKLRHTVK